MLFRKFKKLAGLSITSVVVGLVFAAMFAPSAFATNGHQDHQGACARSTSSIPKGVGDLKFNGVLQFSANAVGIHGFDGSLKKQMEEQLVVGVVAKSVTTSNHGCTGTGGVFGAGGRTLFKGEKVVVRFPLKLGKEVCKHPSGACKKVKIVVHTVFPVSCWNINTGRVEVFIWVRKSHHPKPHHPKKHKKPHKKKPAPECSTKSPNGGGGNCVQQVVTVTPKQECEANNHSGTNCQQTTTTIVANCSNVNYGESTNVNQGGNCNSGGTETCVGQGNCTTHEEETCVNKSCNVTPPPKEECGCKPPEEPPSILITSMTTLNLIAAEKNSGPFKIGVEASKAGGTLTVDPEIGTVSLCDGTAPQEKVVFTNLAAGTSEQCVILYAPEHDADMPTSMKVTVTAVLGSAHDKREQTFKITYPTRPPE